ncbi:MAG: cellulase family glycosylhydrolase [bacterium]|nr:cellulase family glycosylhydrolase [Candidatus Colisoma equi]
MAYTKLIVVAAALAAMGSVSAADESAALPPAFVGKPVPGLVWKTVGSARIENGLLIAELDKVGDAYAQAEIDLSAYDRKPYEIAATVRAENIVDATQTYLGYRFAVNYLDMSMGGNRTWPSGRRIVGDYGPGETHFVDRTEKVRRKAFIQVGICSARGRVTCDLSTLRIREAQPLVPKRNVGYKVKYPDRVKNLPRMRGVMLGNTKGDAWDNLQAWGANLVRYQFAILGAGPVTNFEAYAEGFRANTMKELDNITATLDAAKAHGMMAVLDAHYACGGSCSKELGDPVDWSGDWRVFHDKRFAKLFAWSWQKIAERCKGRTDVVYGYDLMNEAHHTSPAVEGCDLVGLQEKIARAIRMIDPDTPIIVESMYCDPGWFRSLSAIGLDNVIYQVHLYYPHDYTHQGILTSASDVYCWPDPKMGWNKDFLLKSLKPVIDFQKEHEAKMFVGEFSAIAWAPNAEGYIRDCIGIFEELGWDWTYHAYREFPGWSVEHEATSRGKGTENFRPSKDNPRKRVLLSGLCGELAPGGVTDKGRGQ